MKTDIILHGDSAEMLKTLPADSVHCCVTSPPYYGLRDYGINGQIGREETPERYIERLAAVFREVYCQWQSKNVGLWQLNFVGLWRRRCRLIKILLSVLLKQSVDDLLLLLHVLFTLF